MNKSSLKLEWAEITVEFNAKGKDGVVDALMVIGHLLEYMRVLGYGRPKATAKGKMNLAQIKKEKKRHHPHPLPKM